MRTLPTPSRPPRLLAGAASLVVAAAVLLAAPAAASPASTAGTAGPVGPLGGALASTATTVAPPPPSGQVDVIDVSGLMDRIEVDYVIQSLKGAARDHAEALVIQLDSGQGVVSTARLVQLSQAVSNSPTPVAVWVGGRTGARAYGAAFALFRAAAIGGVSPKSHVGKALPSLPGPSGEGPDPVGRAALSADAAVAQGVAKLSAPTLGDFIVGLDGLTAGGTTLHTARVVQAGGEPRREPTVTVSFGKLNLVARLFHTASSPSVAYLLLVIGSLLVIFEFFTVGIGLGAACATGALILAASGLANLPVRPGGVVLIVVGCLGFAIDVQAGAPRAWSVIGAVALAAGTFLLYHGVHASPLAILVGVAGTGLFMVAGMPAMVRTRFATPTIGRQAMIGELGAALADVDPEGTVEVRGAPWRARTNRATPIKAGEPVRVTGIDGLLLEVEPEAGGAKDYRR